MSVIARGGNGRRVAFSEYNGSCTRRRSEAEDEKSEGEEQATDGERGLKNTAADATLGRVISGHYTACLRNRVSFFSPFPSLGRRLPDVFECRSFPARTSACIIIVIIFGISAEGRKKAWCISLNPY